MWLRVLSLLCVFSYSPLVVMATCDDLWRHLAVGSNSGDGGFSIVIDNNPQVFQAGHFYTIRLRGWHSAYLAAKFTAFTIKVVSSRTRTYDALSAGVFKPNGAVQHHASCAGHVAQSSSEPKSQVQLLWMAPTDNSALCVTFSAMVAVSRRTRFISDGALTRELCRAQENPLPPYLASAQNPPHVTHETPLGSALNDGTSDVSCCPCEESEYTMQFQGVWSPQTHPTQFPSPASLNHFSDVLVVSHSSSVTVFAAGRPAGAPLQRLAEFGDTSLLRRHLLQQRGVRSVSRAPGLWQPHVTARTSTQLTVDPQASLVSLVTMLGPSPDWIVGVSSLNLCATDCRWHVNMSLAATLYDAGTDSGATYLSANSPTVPAQPVREITSSWPEASPFHDPGHGTIAPLAHVTLLRQADTIVSCSAAHTNRSHHAAVPDSLPASSTPDACATTAWSSWTQCAPVCGPGRRMRTRAYILPGKATMMKCRRQLVEKVFCDSECTAAESTGRSYSSTADDGDICAVTPWSQWSSCSATCGLGVRTRSRQYLSPNGRTACALDNQQKETCTASVAVCPSRTSAEAVFDECGAVVWSDWSPCSAECHQRGRQFRSRLRLQSPRALAAAASTERCAHAPLSEERQCVTDGQHCQADRLNNSVVCLMAPDVGKCRGHFVRFHFDADTGQCVKFVYSGCRGNRNNFVTKNKCEQMCSGRLGVNSTTRHTSTVNCSVSEWSEWSVCSRACPFGRQSRFRHHTVQSPRQTSSCSEQLVEFRKCRSPNC